MTCWRRLGSALLVVAVSVTLTAQARRTSPERTPPLIPDQTVTKLLNLHRQPEYERRPFMGVYYETRDERLLSIYSNRQLIAFMSLTASKQGGRYTPEPGIRSDVVIMECGSDNPRTTFECARFSVSAGGKAIEPLVRKAARQTLQNLFGYKWNARKLGAIYMASELSNGFSVSFAGTNGFEFVREVAPRSAQVDLLLGLQQ